MAEYKGKLLKNLVRAKNVLLNNGVSVENAINNSLKYYEYTYSSIDASATYAFVDLPDAIKGKKIYGFFMAVLGNGTAQEPPWTYVIATPTTFVLYTRTAQVYANCVIRFVYTD